MSTKKNHPAVTMALLGALLPFFLLSFILAVVPEGQAEAAMGIAMSLGVLASAILVGAAARKIGSDAWWAWGLAAFLFFGMPGLPLAIVASRATASIPTDEEIAARSLPSPGIPFAIAGFWFLCMLIPATLSNGVKYGSLAWETLSTISGGMGFFMFVFLFWGLSSRKSRKQILAARTRIADQTGDRSTSQR